MKTTNKILTLGALMAAMAAGTTFAQASSNATTGASTSNNTNTSTNTYTGGTSGAGSVNTNIGANPTGDGVGVNLDAGAHGNASANGNTSNRMPAVATPSTKNANAPMVGKNSFTQSQVMTRLSRAGYTNISSLEKGKDGIWRGTGTKDGVTSNLMFDYQGNISTGASAATR